LQTNNAIKTTGPTSNKLHLNLKIWSQIIINFYSLTKKQFKPGQTQQVQSLQRTQSAPSFTIISEISNHRAATRLAQNESYRFTDADFAPIPYDQP